MKIDDALLTIKKTAGKYLHEKEYKLILFGSRVSGSYHPYSDLDIGIIGDHQVPLRVMAQINDEFVTSNIPFRVDLVDLQQTSDIFRTLAYKNARYL